MNVIPCATEGSGLQELVAPMSEADFMHKYWTRELLHVTGKAGRFDHLASWMLANQILDEHIINSPRIRMAKNGLIVPPGRFIDNDSDPGYAKLRVDAIAKSLADGSMLVLNNIEDASPGLRTLAKSLEARLSSPVTGVLCANHKRDKGFSLHWDDQEIFVLQIAGSKHWRCYEPTKRFPLSTDSLSDLPTGDPVLDVVLTPGAMLYIPRGWWHVAYPLDEPSLHLSVCVRPLTGVSFMQWIIEELKDVSLARKDVPHLAPTINQEHYSADLLRALKELVCEDGLNRFMAQAKEKLTPRGVFNFPSL